MTEHTIDARRLLCPMPVIRTQDAIALYNAGDLVHVFGTDPGMKQDIPAWCRINGHEVVSISDHAQTQGGDIEITIRVGEAV